MKKPKDLKIRLVGEAARAAAAVVNDITTKLAALAKGRKRAPKKAA